MRFLLSVVFLLSSSALVSSAPPKLTVLPSGELQIVTGGTVLTVKSDGSVTVKSPAIDLTIPGTDGPGPKPVDPVKPDPAKPDPVADQIATLYGSLADDAKKAKAEKLSALWFRAVSLVDTCETLSALNTEIQKLQTLGKEDLLPIREYIRSQINATLGSDPKQPMDKPKARALFTQIATALEKATQ